jgi:hypothetical protein
LRSRDCFFSRSRWRLGSISDTCPLNTAVGCPSHARSQPISVAPRCPQPEAVALSYSFSSPLASTSQTKGAQPVAQDPRAAVWLAAAPQVCHPWSPEPLRFVPYAVCREPDTRSSRKRLITTETRPGLSSFFDFYARIKASPRPREGDESCGS